jgi:hypothetical protein
VEGETIVRQNEVGYKFYFIHRGIIETSCQHFNRLGELTRTDMGYLTEHGYFGEVKILLNSCKRDIP